MYSESPSLIPSIIISGISIIITIIILRYIIEKAVRAALQKELQPIKNISLLNLLSKKEAIKVEKFLKAQDLNKLQEELKSLHADFKWGYLKEDEYIEKKAELSKKINEIFEAQIK